jgi:hypothetical protein
VTVGVHDKDRSFFHDLPRNNRGAQDAVVLIEEDASQIIKVATDEVANCR